MDSLIVGGILAVSGIRSDGRGLFVAMFALGILIVGWWRKVHAVVPLLLVPAAALFAKRMSRLEIVCFVGVSVGSLVLAVAELAGGRRRSGLAPIGALLYFSYFFGADRDLTLWCLGVGTLCLVTFLKLPVREGREDAWIATILLFGGCLPYALWGTREEVRVGCVLLLGGGGYLICSVFRVGGFGMGAVLVGVLCWIWMILCEGLGSVDDFFWGHVLERFPLIWLLEFLWVRYRLVLVLALGVLVAVTVSLAFTLLPFAPTAMIRKVFHLFVLVFLPLSLDDPMFLILAQSGAVHLLCLAEALRKSNPSSTLWISSWTTPFLDDRESPQCIVSTHLWLLLACLLPLMVAPHDPVVALSGVIAVGAMDAVAAVVGSRFGTIQWPTSPYKKSIQGSAAAFASGLLLFSLFTNLPTPSNILVSLLLALFEAHSPAIDNAALPLLAISLLKNP